MSLITVTEWGILFVKTACNNSQNQLVRESIFTALMILMEKKRFSEIKITEIVNKAGVSRMSYYRNYDSKEDIINTYLDEMLNEYMEIISNYDKYDRYHRKYLFIACFKNNERLIKNLVHSGLTPLILERINKFVDKVIALPPNEKSHLPEADQQNMRFAVGGLFNVMIEWFNDGMSENIEELAARLSGNPD